MYKGVGQIFGRYWKNYGGWTALVCSFYLHVALALTVVTYPIWKEAGWWGQVLGILPNLLGFTIGGFTLFLGIGSEKFRTKLAQRNGDDASPLIQISASYVHFIVMQTVAIFSAIIAQATNSPTPKVIVDFLRSSCVDPTAFFDKVRLLGWGFSYLMFLYALTLVVAACMAVFRTASWSEEFVPPSEGRETQP